VTQRGPWIRFDGWPVPTSPAGNLLSVTPQNPLTGITPVNKQFKINVSREQKVMASAMADSLIRFTRGLGMARSGDVAGAKKEIEEMKVLRTTLQSADQSYWADRTEEQMLAVSSWVALKEGDTDRALKFMRAAADSEDGSVKNVIMENRLYPLRELLADLLLEMGMAAPALREYEVALKAYPNRYRGIYGTARAADAAGDRRKAADYYGKLLALSKNADGARPELARAKSYVAQR